MLILFYVDGSGLDLPSRVILNKLPSCQFQELIFMKANHLVYGIPNI